MTGCHVRRRNVVTTWACQDGCLNRWLFGSVHEAREASEASLQEYNGERSHGSLGGRAPSKFFEQGQEDQGEAA